MMTVGWPRSAAPTVGSVSHVERALVRAIRVLVGLGFVLFSLHAFGQDRRESSLPVSSPVQLERGLVVEHVSRNRAAARAGLLPGDILLGWKQGEARGELSSPFDVPYVFFDQSPRGPITFIGSHGGRQRTWVVASDPWGVVVRPNMQGALLSLYDDGEKSLAAKNWNGALTIFRNAAAVSAPVQSTWLPAWLLSHSGKALSTARQWDLFDAVYNDAIEQAANAGPEAKAELFRLWADGFDLRDDLESAERYYTKALLEYQELGLGTLAESNAFGLLAVVELKRGKFDVAEDHLLQAMRVETILAPASLQTTTIVGDLAVLYQDRGQLEEAEQYYFKVKDLEEKYFPRSIYLARTLEDLGILFDQEGDLVRSETYERRALLIAERLEPEKSDVADILASLAECLLERGELLKAETYEKRALTIRQKEAPDGISVAYSLATLGKLARFQGDPARAEAYYRRALEIAAKVDSPVLDRARFLIGLAAALRDAGDFGQAESLYRQAAGILEKEAPGSIDRATTLAELAGTLRRQGRQDEATQFYRQAMTAFENQTVHLGQVAETGSRYRSEHLRYYQEYMDLLVTEGHQEQAFEVLEASRARTLFEMLGQGRVDLGQAGDPVLRARRRRLQGLLNAESEYRIQTSARPHAQEELDQIDGKLQELLLQLQQVEAQMRADDPKHVSKAAWPFTAAEIQSLLDPNTLLLEYSLGEEKGYVWAVTDKSLTAYLLPKRSEIENVANRVYRLLTDRNRNTQLIDRNRSVAQYRVASRRLAQIVLEPVAHLLQEKRLLIVADGVLQYIPFSALPVPSSSAGTVPLIVSHEIVNLPSASVLGELRRLQITRPRAPYAVAVLADPVFDPNDDRVRGEHVFTTSSFKNAPAGKLLIRSASDVGLTRDGNVYLGRLLYTRNEAAAVMAASRPDRAISALDFEASRTLAMSGVLANYRIIHFATHGILNNKHPELSGLVLSLVNKRGKPQDGFLKLHDIYNLRLSADLVVLSGCETALGEQIEGEGIVGLTRAFMYAGASKVMASLWKVSDMATAQLMADFYKAMEKDGMRPAAALRRAQVRMWQEKQWRSPYFWAAFQIQGDWQ